MTATVGKKSIVLGLSLLLGTCFCVSFYLPSNTVDAERIDQEILLDNIAPNTIARHTFRVLNTTKRSVAITKVKASCLCLFAKDIVGVEASVGEALEVPCILPVDRLPQEEIFHVYTNSSDPGLSHIKLKLAVFPKIKFRVSTESLYLSSTDEAKSVELIVSSEGESLIDAFPRVMTSNELVVVDVVDVSSTAIRYAVSISSKSPSMGRFFDCIYFDFNDDESCRIEVKAEINRGGAR